MAAAKPPKAASSSSSSASVPLEAPADYARLLGVRARDRVVLAEKVATGLPYRVLESLQHEMGLPLSDLSQQVQITKRTLTRRKDQGRFQPDESDRLVRVARIYSLALALFEGSRDEALRWLKEPKRALRGESPFDLARTEVGAREVEALIGRLEHAVWP